MKKAFNEQEKRKFRRIKKRFEVKLRVYSRDASTRYGEYDMAFLQDISAGGALFNFSRELKIATLVELQIIFPTLPQPVKCLGKVVRVEPSAQPKTPGEPSLYNIAVRFIETVDKKEEELLNKAIEEYYSRQMNNK